VEDEDSHSNASLESSDVNNVEAGLHHNGMHKGGELDDTPPNHLGATHALGAGGMSDRAGVGDGMSERARKWLKLEEMAASNPLSQAS